ncbi:MAG TPA: VapC toxin family PIN domain ribonuclease [Terriglobia bacterium]|nr:VapC toxin family PIN domain ribonuclease [Terriglobia bacterium]
MIEVDTNILVYAPREDLPWNPAAFDRLRELAEGLAAWAIVTHLRIYRPPTSLEFALDQVEAWMELPSLVILGEAPGYWPDLRATLAAARAGGPQIHDACVAALCRLHEVRELWSANRDFGRFANLKVTHPPVV